MSSSSPTEIGTLAWGFNDVFANAESPALGWECSDFVHLRTIFIYPCWARRIHNNSPQPVPTSAWFLCILPAAHRERIGVRAWCSVCLSSSCEDPFGSTLSRKVAGETDVWVALEKPSFMIMDLFKVPWKSALNITSVHWELCTGRLPFLVSCEGIILFPSFPGGTHLESTWHTVKQA